MLNAEAEVITRGPALRDQVYSLIRERIISGDLEPGRVLVEVELASELKVSRTPVSNALVMLKERGLVEEDGGRLRVPILQLEDVVQLYWCRMAHDGLASRLAAERINPGDLKKLEHYLRAWENPQQENDHSALWVSDLKFHQLIYRVAGNKHLLRFAETTLELAAVYQRNTIRRMTSPTSGTGRSREDVKAEHEAIYRAIAARNPDQAEEAARQHIRMVIKHLEHADVLL
jgi:DNA-binding GntR family transcriptional regulator